METTANLENLVKMWERTQKEIYPDDGSLKYHPKGHTVDPTKSVEWNRMETARLNSKIKLRKEIAQQMQNKLDADTLLQIPEAIMRDCNCNQDQCDILMMEVTTLISEAEWERNRSDTPGKLSVKDKIECYYMPMVGFINNFVKAGKEVNS